MHGPLHLVFTVGLGTCMLNMSDQPVRYTALMMD